MSRETGSMKPEHIEQISATVLVIRWDDGRRCVYFANVLREHCPCAVCAEERKDTNPLKVIPGDPAAVEIVSWKMVGRYAISIEWSDRHDTGIYTYEFLRELCGRG